MSGPRRLLSIALLSIISMSCAPSPEARRGEALLLLTIDTLRADRLGIGGDPQARTPHLDRIARAGVQHAVALAPAPLTLPSHATILTGLLPPDHGARDNGLYRVREDTPLISDAFGSAGWNTGAFLAAMPLAARFGLARGFDVYADAGGVRPDGSASPFVERPADRVNAELFEWLDANPSRDPLFLWVHYFDPHAPYAPPRHYRRAAGDTYRGEIMFADRQAGALERRLVERFTDVKLCVTADHGESLGEHEEETHGVFVYESTTRVPLFFRGAGMPEGRVDSRPVSLASVAATLLAWAGLDEASESFVSDDSYELYLESMYPPLRHGWAPLRALRSDEWKIVRAPKPEIFHLPSDPGETNNLYDDPRAREATEAMFTRIADPRFAMTPPGIEKPDPEVEEALQSLGYAAPARRLEPEESGLPDPKERIRIERLLTRAGSALEAGNLRAARSLLASALSFDSRNKETQIMLGRLEAMSGNFDRAFEVFDWCLTLPPASADALVHYEAGRIALDAGRLELAEDRFAQSVAQDPLNVDALFNWGVAAYRREHWSDAAERWRAALALDPRHGPARRWLPDVENRISGERGS